MAVELPLELLQWLYKVLLNEYKDPKRTYQDVCLILINYNTLKPRTRIYTNQYGTPQLLLNLYGTLQTTSGELPIDIWFPFEYPSVAPLIYILTTERYIIKPTNNVQQDGLVFHPFLYNWSLIDDDTNGRNFKILTLMTILVELLNSNPPFLFKPRQTELQSQLQSQRDQDIPPQLPPLPPKPKSTPTPTTEVSVSSRSITSPVEKIRSPSPPVYKELEQLSLMDQDNSSANVPQLPPNPTRLELLNNLQMMLTTTGQLEIESVLNQEVLLVLENSTKELLYWQNEILKIEQDQKYLHEKIGTNNVILDDKINQVILLNKLLKEQPSLNLDELITAPTLQHQQLYDLVTRDKSITDTIMTLTKLYELEKMQLSQLMKFVRNLARDQFLTRALIKKIIRKLNLNSGGAGGTGDGNQQGLYSMLETYR